MDIIVEYSQNKTKLGFLSSSTSKVPIKWYRVRKPRKHSTEEHVFGDNYDLLQVYNTFPELVHIQCLWEILADIKATEDYDERRELMKEADTALKVLLQEFFNQLSQGFKPVSLHDEIGRLRREGFGLSSDFYGFPVSL